MDLYVAVGTPHVIDEMRASIVFGSFHLVASVAGDRFGLDSGALRRVFIDIRDVPVAAIAGIGAVDRSGELPFVDIFMAFQALRVVDTLQTVLPSPDLELLLCQLKLLATRIRRDEKNKSDDKKGIFELGFIGDPCLINNSQIPPRS